MNNFHGPFIMQDYINSFMLPSECYLHLTNKIIEI